MMIFRKRKKRLRAICDFLFFFFYSRSNTNFRVQYPYIRNKPAELSPVTRQQILGPVHQQSPEIGRGKGIVAWTFPSNDDIVPPSIQRTLTNHLYGPHCKTKASWFSHECHRSDARAAMPESYRSALV